MTEKEIVIIAALINAVAVFLSVIISYLLSRRIERRNTREEVKRRIVELTIKLGHASSAYVDSCEKYERNMEDFSEEGKNNNISERLLFISRDKASLWGERVLHNLEAFLSLCLLKFTPVPHNQRTYQEKRIFDEMLAVHKLIESVMKENFDEKKGDKIGSEIAPRIQSLTRFLDDWVNRSWLSEVCEKKMHFVEKRYRCAYMLIYVACVIDTILLMYFLFQWP